MPPNEMPIFPLRATIPPMNQEQSTIHSDANNELPVDNRSRFIKGAGIVLAVSYPVLAVSAFFRGIYQLFLKESEINPVGPGLTLIASLLYFLATFGFAIRRRWAWYLSVIVLGIETVFTLVVGLLSILYPEMIGSTVWRYFGIDYAFFPLIQPLIGLAWLLYPATMQAYDIRKT